MSKLVSTLASWQPQVMTAETFTGGLLAVQGGKIASAGGLYGDLFGRDGLRIAKAEAERHPEVAIGVLTSLAQFQGVHEDRYSNAFPGAIPHQVHRQVVDGVIGPDSLDRESFGWARRWGVPARQNRRFGRYFVVYNTSDAQCLFVIVLAKISRLHPGAGVLARRFYHWESLTARTLGAAARQVLELICSLVAQSDLGLYEYPNTNPQQTSPSGVLFDLFDAYWHPALAGQRPVNWDRVAYIHNQQLAYEALLCGADLFPDHRDAGLWRDMAASLRYEAVQHFGLNRGTTFPPAAIDRDSIGRPRPVRLESIAALELLEGRFLHGLPFAPDLVRQLVLWLYHPRVMTPVGGRCLSLAHAGYEGEYAPQQGTPAVWPITNWITAEGLYNWGLYPAFHDLAVLRMAGGMDRTGSGIEFWPVHRRKGAVCYHPYDFERGDAQLVMACASQGQRQQGWSLSSGHAALSYHSRGYPELPQGSWQAALWAEASRYARGITPAAAMVPEAPVFIDTARGRVLEALRAQAMGVTNWGP